MKFLVIDDFSMVRYLLKMNLKDFQNCEIEEAESGEVAVSKMRKAAAEGKPFDLIFCDWNMPNINGMGVLSACQSDPLLKNIVFVMMTADADPGSVQQAKSAGVHDYLIKPWIPSTLHAIVDRFSSGERATTKAA